MSGLVSGERSPGRGAGGPSIDQVIAQKIGNDSRFRSLQIGVCQESFGESIQRNMSWAGRDRPLPPEMIPHRLFDRLFGSQGAVLDRAEEEHPRRRERRGEVARSRRSASGDQQRLDEYLTSVRSLERSDRQPAAGVFAGRRAAAGRGRPEGLAADRQAADRPAGARPGLAARRASPPTC